MKVLDSFFDALRSLAANSLRSILTTLGIIIGVCAVIIMVAVSNGAKARMDQLIQSLGSNILTILPGSSRQGGARGGAGSIPSLTEDDAEAIQNELPDVTLTAPLVRGSVQIVAGNLNWSTVAGGVTPDFFAAREWHVEKGRIFTAAEIKSSAKVVLLGASVAGNLFSGQNPVGQTLRIRRVPFEVIGLLEAKGPAPNGMDQDDVVLIPMTTAKKRVMGGRELGGKVVSSIIIQVRNPDTISRVEAQVTDLLRQRHHITVGQEDDFWVRNLVEMLKTRADSSQAMGVLLMVVASVSLIVGGIGIMNIMLVSVTERTREIGLRMALGATGQDILSQFLIESVLLSLIGGLIGVILGIGGAVVTASLSRWPTIVNPESVLLAFGFSAAVGIFFGFYPARKASCLDPIEALRHE